MTKEMTGGLLSDHNGSWALAATMDLFTQRLEHHIGRVRHLGCLILRKGCFGEHLSRQSALNLVYIRRYASVGR